MKARGTGTFTSVVLNNGADILDLNQLEDVDVDGEDGCCECWSAVLVEKVCVCCCYS